jgi:hypothetical protein
MFTSYRRIPGRVLVALCFALSTLLWAPLAQAAGLAFGVSALTPAARPTVTVTVSGAQVFNGPTSGFTIPVNTTGHVVIRIGALPDYQVFEGWTGECAGVPFSQPCEFDAGLPVTYAVGAIFRNRTGTLRFTASSLDEVRAPLTMTLNQTSTPDGSTGAITVSTQANAVPLTRVVGSHGFDTPSLVGSACLQSATQANVSAVVQEGQETVVNVAFKTDRCAVTVNVLDAAKGSATSAPAGIDCPLGPVDAQTGSACSAYFGFRSQVRLTPHANPGFAFAGWSGCTPALERVCTAVAQQGSAKVPSFAAAAAGSADLAIAAGDIAATDAGGGKVRIAVTLRNLGADAAAGVRVELGSSAAGVFSEIPSVVSDGGSCNAVGFCSWSLGDLAAGASKTVSFTAGSARTEFPMRACTLGSTADPVAGNDCAGATITLAGNPPPPPLPPGPALVSTGPLPPADGIALKAATDVPALQFSVAPPAGATASYAMTGVTINASGSGQDALDITAVRIYADANGNGVVDAAEKALLIAGSSFTVDDGTTRIDFAPSAVPAARSYLVTLDMNNTLAANAAAALQAGGLAGVVGLAMWGVAGGARRRRTATVAGLVAISMMEASCGGGGGGGGSATPAEKRLYKLTLLEVRMQADGQPVAATGTPLAGAQIRVER